LGAGRDAGLGVLVRGAHQGCEKKTSEKIGRQITTRKSREKEKLGGGREEELVGVGGFSLYVEDSTERGI